MTTPLKKPVSPFVQSALTLDDDFAQFERLAGELERLAIDSDNGMERARLVLTKFSEYGQKIAEGVQTLAKTLDEARGRAEAAAQLVSERAALVQERQHEVDRMLERFRRLGEMVRQVTTMAAQLQKPNGTLSPEERDQVIQKLPELDSQLGVLIDEAMRLKADAQSANMQDLEKNADSLGQSLQAVRKKLVGFNEASYH